MLGFTKKRIVMTMAVALFPATVCTSSNTVSALAIISSNNSSMTFDPGPVATPAPYITSWMVDGVNQFGGTSTGDSISYFNGSSFTALNSNTPSSATYTANVGSATYDVDVQGEQFTVNVQDILLGGSTGSGASGITQTITVNNIGFVPSNVVQPDSVNDSPVSFTLQDLVNAHVNGNANNTLTLSPSGAPNQAVQTDPTGVKFTYTTTPVPSSFDISNGSTTTASVGPQTGNESFLFDWNFSLAPGDTGIVSITESLSAAPTTSVPGVPLPSSAQSAFAALAGLGAIGIARRLRRTPI